MAGDAPYFHTLEVTKNGGNRASSSVRVHVQKKIKHSIFVFAKRKLEEHISECVSMV